MLTCVASGLREDSWAENGLNEDSYLTRVVTRVSPMKLECAKIARLVRLPGKIKILVNKNVNFVTRVKKPTLKPNR